MENVKDKTAVLSGKAGNLRKRIKKKQERRDELAEQLAEARERVEEVEAAFVDGNATEEDLQALRGRQDTLSSVVERAEEQLSNLNERLQRIEADHEREQTLKRLEKLANDATKLLDKEESLQRSLAETFEEKVEAVGETRAERKKLEAAFRGILRNGDDSPGVMVERLREGGADPAGVLAPYASVGDPLPPRKRDQPNLGNYAGLIREQCSNATRKHRQKD